MSGAVIFSPLTEAYIAEAVAVQRICFSSALAEKAALDCLTSPQNRYFIATADGAIVGCGGYTAAADQADIIDVSVLPAYRRRGIARRLMEMILEDASAHGVKSVFLEVRASNTPAAMLYASLGFSHCGVRKNYYTAPREDAVLMMCALSDVGEGAK